MTVYVDDVRHRFGRGYGPSEHVARLRGNTRMLELIASARASAVERSRDE